MKVCLAPLAVAITAALATQSVSAQIPPTHSIFLEENSPTSLTATYDGSTSGISVTNISQDAWSVTFSSNAIISQGSFDGWAEPGNSNTNNFVFTPSQGLLSLSVVSDVSGSASNADDSASPLVFGIDMRDSGKIFVTFDDDAAQREGEVPDTGSTFVLLFLSLTALFGAIRFRSLRLA